MVFGEIEGQYYNSIKYYKRTCPDEMFNALNNQANRKTMQTSQASRDAASPSHSTTTSRRFAITDGMEEEAGGETDTPYNPIMGTMQAIVVPEMASLGSHITEEMEDGEDNEEGEDEDEEDILDGEVAGDDDGDDDVDMYEDPDNDLEYSLLPWEDERDRALTVATAKHTPKKHKSKSKSKSKVSSVPKVEITLHKKSKKASSLASSAASVFSSATTASKAATQHHVTGAGMKQSTLFKGIIPSKMKKTQEGLESSLFNLLLAAPSLLNSATKTQISEEATQEMEQQQQQEEVVIAGEEQEEEMLELSEPSTKVGSVRTPAKKRRIIEDEDEDEVVSEPVHQKKLKVFSEDEEDTEDDVQSETGESEVEEGYGNDIIEDEEGGEDDEDEEEEEEEEEVDEDAALDSEEEEEAYDDEIGVDNEKKDYGGNPFLLGPITTSNNEDDENGIREDENENASDNICVSCKKAPATLTSTDCSDTSYCEPCFDAVKETVSSSKRFTCTCGDRHLIVSLGY
jgi:hypothetical protein